MEGGGEGGKAKLIRFNCQIYYINVNAVVYAIYILLSNDFRRFEDDHETLDIKMQDVSFFSWFISFHPKFDSFSVKTPFAPRKKPLTLLQYRK